MRSFADRASGPEQMDDADLDPAIYARVLKDLAKANSWTFARRPTLGFLARALRGREAFSLLDIGYGHGDMLRSIARWAGRRGLEATLVGVDLNAGSASAARAATAASLPIEFRTGDYAVQPERFDLIVSSLVAHHMSDRELKEFLKFMEANARLGWMVNDLHRHRGASLLFPPLARAMRWHSIVRADGALSIARSFRPADWHRLLAESGIPLGVARVTRRFPFRLCVERTR